METGCTVRRCLTGQTELVENVIYNTLIMTYLTETGRTWGGMKDEPTR